MKNMGESCKHEIKGDLRTVIHRAWEHQAPGDVDDQIWGILGLESNIDARHFVFQWFYLS
jgi:hypothetical protein